MNETHSLTHRYSGEESIIVDRCFGICNIHNKLLLLSRQITLLKVACHAHATNPLDLLCLIDYKFTVEMLCYGYRCDCKSLHIFLEKETLVEACSN